jgi:hypothetical protein
MRDTIDMAREVKMPYDFVTGEPINLEKLEAFADLVRADEREACAKKTEEFARKWWKIHCGSNKHMETTRKAHNDFCALQAAIRARGKTIMDTTPPAQPEPELVRELKCVIADLIAECKELRAAQPAPVQPVAWANPNELKNFDMKVRTNGGPLHTVPLCLCAPPAQPAVPDAIHHTDTSETLEYIQGWNDCRAETLKMRKP